MNNIKYVQLEPDAFLSDLDFQVMTDRQRGIYFSLILYLYRNGGKIPNNAQALLKLCSSCASTFTDDWSAIKHKFQVTETEIRHKRVSEELEKAFNLYENRRKAGQKGGFSHKKRDLEEQAELEQSLSGAKAEPEQCSGSKAKQSNSNANNITIANNNSNETSIRPHTDGDGTEIAIDKNSSNDFELTLQKNAVLVLNEIENLLHPRSQREQDTFAKVMVHITNVCRSKEAAYHGQIFNDFVSLAKEAASSHAANKKGLFVSLVKKRYGFNVKSK